MEHAAQTTRNPLEQSSGMRRKSTIEHVGSNDSGEAAELGERRALSSDTKMRGSVDS